MLWDLCWHWPPSVCTWQTPCTETMQDTNPSKHQVSCTLDAASESCSLCQHLAASLDRQTARLHKATLFHWPKCSLIRTVTSTGLATTFTSALFQQLFHNLLLHLLQHSLHPVRSIAAFIAGCEAHSAFFAAHKVCCRIIAACKVYCSCMLVTWHSKLKVDSEPPVG